MATVPSSHTFIDAVATSSEQNTYVRDPITFILKPPMAELRQPVAQTIATGTPTALTFTASDVDTDYAGGTGHSNSVNTSRYTANYAGWYQVSGGITWQANATGVRTAEWRVNGSAVLGTLVELQTVTGGLACGVPARTKLVYLNVSDYVELWVQQTSGGNLGTSGGTTEQGSMSVRWVSN